MSHCKACDAPIPHSFIDDAETIEEYVCAECRRKTWMSMRMQQHEFEGLWWDRHWDGIEYHVLEHAANT